jgi:hypothetical protein
MNNNNEQEKQKLWKIYMIFMGIMIVGGTLILTTQWVWGAVQNAIRDNERKAAVQNSITNTQSQPSPSATETPSFTSSPIATATPSSTPSPVQTSAEPVNPYENLSYPLLVCGETLPTDPKAYPVNLYPVFVFYSDANFQAIKTRFCDDVILMPRKKKNITSLQVASFLSIEKANLFRDFLIKKRFSGVEVGEPTQRLTKP